MERGGKTKTQIGENYGNNERSFGVRCTLRASNKALESKNEKIYFWRKKEYSYY